MYFVDASVLLKSYIPEKGSDTVHEAFALLDGSLFMSDIVAIETLGSLTKYLRSGTISDRTYQQARRDLLWDLSHRFAIVPVEPALGATIGLVHQYRSRAPGALDVLHLATVEYLQSAHAAETAWLLTSDGALKKLAKTRDLDVFDPESDDLEVLGPPVSDCTSTET